MIDVDYSTIKELNINGGVSVTLICPDYNQRAKLAGDIASWSAVNTNAAWCIAPDPLGDLEITYCLPLDMENFKEWMMTKVDVVTTPPQQPTFQ